MEAREADDCAIMSEDDDTDDDGVVDDGTGKVSKESEEATTCELTMAASCTSEV